MPSSRHPEFVPVAILASLSLLLPLPWHWRSQNIAILAVMFWLFVMNVVYAVDAKVWAGSVVIESVGAKVWCDITTKLTIGANFALPAATLCICMHLKEVAYASVKRSSAARQRRRRIFDAVLCFGIPVLVMALHIVVQGHRFNVIEDYGCRPATDQVAGSVVIIFIPPLILSVFAAIYAVLAMLRFVRLRKDFASHLVKTESAFTTSCFIRLMLMSAIQMVWTTSAATYLLWFDTVTSPVLPYESWTSAHFELGTIWLIPTVLMSPDMTECTLVVWWLVPTSTFVFVAFFAFGPEAVADYRRAWSWIRSRILRRKVQSDEEIGPISFVTKAFPESSHVDESSQHSVDSFDFEAH